MNIQSHKGLVVVVVKKNRLNSNSSLAFHSHKCFGGVLNPNACHGRGHYVRRTVGQDVMQVQEKLSQVVATLQHQ